MKKLFKYLLIVFIITSVFSFDGISAKNDLDYIRDYEITIDPLNDGTLKITYSIKWEVLDSESDGPLTWVKIGIANPNATILENISKDVIKELYVEGGKDDARVEVYFYKKYYKGEIVDFSFSIIQDYAFTNADDKIEYRFNPGYFEEIQVEKCTVKWNVDHILYANTTIDDGNYCVWETKLDYGETFNVDVKYNKTLFPSIDLNKSYNDYLNKEKKKTILIISIFVLGIAGFVLLIIYVSRESSDGYYYYSGFSGRRFMHFYHHPSHYAGYNRKATRIIVPESSSGSSGSTSSSTGSSHCACACACACAGGGRAGCSRKDFTKEKQLHQ